MSPAPRMASECLKTGDFHLFSVLNAAFEAVLVPRNVVLGGVSGSRASIMEAMVFCMDKSEWALEITETITESLTIVETEIPLKMARREVSKGL